MEKGQKSGKADVLGVTQFYCSLWRVCIFCWKWPDFECSP